MQTIQQQLKNQKKRFYCFTFFDLHFAFPRAGFTLIEVVLVLVILGVIAGLSYPYIRDYIVDYKLNGETRNLVISLRQAQQFTVTEQVTHLVNLDLPGNRYRLEQIPDAAFPDTRVLVAEVTFDPAITFQSYAGLTNDTDEVWFNAAGGAVDIQDGTIVLENSQGDVATINVKPSGFIESL